MAKLVKVEVVCDLDPNHIVPQSEATTLVFEWLGKRYALDVDQQCEATIDMNTIGGLLEVARIATDEDEDRPRMQRVAAKKAANGAKTQPATRERQGGAPKGGKRYSLAQYMTVFGTVENGAYVLKCPHDDETFSKNVKTMRAHLFDAHGDVMNQLATKIIARERLTV